MARARHDVALWAAVAAFFGNAIGLELLDRLTHNDWWQLFGVVIVSLFVGGAVYARERLVEARHEPGKPPRR